MTDVSAQQQLRLPVDASPPAERLGRPLLLVVGVIVLALHLALVVVFTPLAPEPVEAGVRTGHSASFMSSGVTAASPVFMKTVDTYDPIAFLHPPESVGFSFFRASGDDFSLEAPSEPVLLPPKFTEPEPLPPFEPEPVARQLARDAADTDDALETEVASVSGLSYPYCVADSKSDVKFPAFPLDAQTERILRRSPPSRPSVFELRSASVPPPSATARISGSSDPSVAVILTESCGDAGLDLAARAWLDTLLNSQDAPEQMVLGDRCRVIWSAKALRKEPSAR